jgi:dihydrodipicolinate synthase/N-acetylneuraminate lyase
MAGLSSPRGLILDLITPLKKGGDIDGRGLGRHLDRVLPHVQGLLLSGPAAGEGRGLDAQHREELLEKVLVVVRGRVPVLVWITRDSEEKTRETLLLLERRVESRGHRGPIFWVDTPLYYHSNRGLPFHYRDLSSLTARPILLHNDPDLIQGLARPLKRNNRRTGILKELTSLECIRGLIFLGSLDRSRNYQKAARTRSDFRIYDGEEAHFLTHPSLSGVVSVGANLAPRAWSKITASSLNLGGNEKAYPDHLRQIWETGVYLRNLMDIYRDRAVPLIKRVLFDMGIFEEAAPTSGAGDPGEAPRLLKELMDQYGEKY